MQGKVRHWRRDVAERPRRVSCARPLREPCRDAAREITTNFVQAPWPGPPGATWGQARSWANVSRVRHRRSPSSAAGIGVGAALLVAALWWWRPRAPIDKAATESTVAVRISRHDALGMPSSPVSVGDPTKVRALVEALAVDAHPSVPCPPDYSSAELGIVLAGRDVYARRNVYVWTLFADGGLPTVLVVSSAGCRGGPPADPSALRDLVSSAERDATR